MLEKTQMLLFFYSAKESEWFKAYRLTNKSFQRNIVFKQKLATAWNWKLLYEPSHLKLTQAMKTEQKTSSIFRLRVE